MSQEQMILNHLEKGLSITSLEALKMFGCLRLSSRIHELKLRGYDIFPTIIRQGKKKFASYKLVKDKQLQF